MPSNYGTCFELLKVASKLLLIILGLGSSKISKIREKKETHTWSAQIMNQLLEAAGTYENNGRSPQPSADEGTMPYKVDADRVTFSNIETKDEGTSKAPDSLAEGRSKSPDPRESSIFMTEMRADTEKVKRLLEFFPVGDNKISLEDKKIVLMALDKPKTTGKEIETPILLAAKNGITEMVEKILEKFPVAINDMNADKKNVVLLAVEHRQPHVYQFLQHTKIVKGKDHVFRHVDDKGNSAMHLAATLGDYKPWLIPGAALQMQWEQKWYKFVKESQPHNFFLRYNKLGKTPKDIFIDTHQELVKSGGEWLTHTSESCSVVAALIATVAFATSATVPGGVNDDTGAPTLGNQPAFDVFAISSLIALCFSITAVVMFLAILTSRYEEKDFRHNLPRKLLVGLTSLFVSIAAMLVSFCAGHFFVLKDVLKFAASSVYAVTCLPVTFFAIAQFRLCFDLVWATFKEVPQRSYMVVTL